MRSLWLTALTLCLCAIGDEQVIGQTTSVAWSLLDPTNPSTGGVSLTFAGVPASADDPFWCPFNSTSGTQNERIATYNIKCDASVSPATLDVRCSPNGSRLS